MNKKINKKLTTKYIGRNIFYFPEIDSTQKEVWRRVEEKNIQNGDLVLADIQTDGIGTHGRKWYTSKKNNIAFSFLLCPNIDVKQLESLTIQIAEIILKVIKNLYKIDLTIKKPNDIMIGTRKIGGILTQTKLQGESVKYLVIGIGLNTNQSYFEQEIEDIATSIKNEYQKDIDNSKVIAEFCNLFEIEWEKRF